MIWIKFLFAAAYPDEATPQDRKRFARLATAVAGFGILLLGAAVVFLVMFFMERRAYGPAPDTAIAVADFTPANLTGALQDARIKGVLHLDKMRLAQIANGNQRVLIPLTDGNWTDGDPIPVLIQTHLFIYDQQLQISGERYDLGLTHLELPPNSTGPTPVWLIVKSPVRPVVTAPENTLLLEYVRDDWRNSTIARETSGLRMVAQIFGFMGLVCALIGVWARRSLTKDLP